MFYKIGYYMKGKSKESASFETYKEAVVFMKALAIHSDCEAFKLEKSKYAISTKRVG